MNKRSTGILAAVTVVTVILSITSIRKRKQASAAAVRDQVLVPELGQRINDVAQLQVKSADGTFTIARGESNWGMVEKADYPVDQGKVRTLLFALKDAEVLETKTSKPALYPRLGVEGVDAQDSASIELTVSDSAGAKLAEVVVGKRGASSSRDTYYVRRMGEAPSFLVEGDLTIDKSDSAWLDKQIVDLERERVKAIEILHTDGERVFAHKADQAATDFELADIPEGKELRYAGAPGSLATSLARLDMEDVRAAADVDLPEQSLAVSTFWTFDGLKVVATVYEVEEELLATFAAEYDAEGPAMNAFEGQGALADNGLAIADPAIEAPDSEVAPTEGATPAEVQSEAQSLATKTAPWVYVLPTWKKSSLAKTMEELTKDLPPPPPPEEVLEVEPLEGDPQDHTPGDGHDHDHGEGDGH